jgi:CDGSH-type Zn-finger protein
MSEEKVKVTVKPDGSIRVEGDFELNYTKAGQDQVTTEVIEKSSKSLCRCGHSADKPFCDGSHRAAGFKG